MHLLSLYSRCLQNPDILPIVAKSMALDFTPTGVSEDCLYLNVYTPSQRSESDKLPVSTE